MEVPYLPQANKWIEKQKAIEADASRTRSQGYHMRHSTHRTQRRHVRYKHHRRHRRYTERHRR